MVLARAKRSLSVEQSRQWYWWSLAGFGRGIRLKRRLGCGAVAVTCEFWGCPQLCPHAIVGLCLAVHGYIALL